MANKIYIVSETAITWKSSGGTEAFFITGTPGALGSGAGRQGALHDFGTAVKSHRYRWRARITPGATQVVDEVIGIFWKTGDGTTYDNDDGVADQAVSAIDKLKNVTPIGTIVIDEAAAVVMSAHGEIEFSERWGGPIFWNYTANSLSSTMTTYGFDLQPIPDEIQ